MGFYDKMSDFKLSQSSKLWKSFRRDGKISFADPELGMIQKEKIASLYFLFESIARKQAFSHYFK